MSSRKVPRSRRNSAAAANPLGNTGSGRGNPNAGGAGAKTIRRVPDALLARLGTYRIGLYRLHIRDGVTPVEKIVQPSGDLLRAGKILHCALPDMPVPLAMQAATIAAGHRVAGPVAMRVEHSPVARDVEAEHVLAVREAGLGVVPWRPLAGGFLAGKCRKGGTGDTGRPGGANPFGQSKFTDRNRDILDVLRAVAEEAGASPPR